MSSKPSQGAKTEKLKEKHSNASDYDNIITRGNNQNVFGH